MLRRAGLLSDACARQEQRGPLNLTESMTVESRGIVFNLSGERVKNRLTRVFGAARWIHSLDQVGLDFTGKMAIEPRVGS